MGGFAKAFRYILPALRPFEQDKKGQRAAILQILPGEQMPKTSSLTKDIPEPFLRQRRNMMLISVLLIAIVFYGKNPDQTVSLSGLTFKMSLCQVMLWGLFFLVYFTWRAWQRIDFALFTITPEDQNAVLRGLVNAGFACHPNTNLNEVSVERYSLDRSRVSFMAKVGENGLRQDCMISTHQDKAEINNKLRTFCRRTAKGTRLAAKCPELADVSEFWGLILSEERDSPNAIIRNDIAPKLEVFDLMRKTPRTKQFWKHPYFSDFHLPFILAWFAMGLTLGKLLLLATDCNWFWTLTTGGFLVMASVVAAVLLLIRSEIWWQYTIFKESAPK
ncbi:MAG: hypothetical protein RRB13_10455 [bacterium]|nr:hypothetical protein [bacterium]